MRYEYCVASAASTEVPVSSEALTVLGRDGWLAYAVVSRPGMVERVFLRRECVPPPAPVAPPPPTRPAPRKKAR